MMEGADQLRVRGGDIHGECPFGSARLVFVVVRVLTSDQVVAVRAAGMILGDDERNSGGGELRVTLRRMNGALLAII